MHNTVVRKSIRYQEEKIRFGATCQRHHEAMFGRPISVHRLFWSHDSRVTTNSKLIVYKRSVA